MTNRSPRIVIEDLSPLATPTEQEMADVFGAGRQKKWQYSGQAMEVLEVRQMMSATNSAARMDQAATEIPQSLFPHVKSALQNLEQRMTSTTAGFFRTTLPGNTLSPEVKKILTELLSQAAVAQSTSELGAKGISLVSKASDQDISRFLAGGGAAKSDLIVLLLSGDVTRRITGELSGQQAVSVSGTSVSASVTGQQTGDLHVVENLIFGLDASGRVFVREGSTVQSDMNASGQVKFSGAAGKSVFALTGTDNLAATAAYNLNDGDSISDEKLYLATDDLFSRFGKSDAPSGTFTLNDTTMEFVLGGAKTQISFPVSAGWDLSKGSATATLTDAQLADAVARMADAAIDHVQDRIAPLARKAEHVPLLGQSVADTLRTLMNDQTELDVPALKGLEYLKSKGIKVVSMVSVRSLLSGQFTDIFLLSWSGTVKSDAISVMGSGEFGKAGGIRVSGTGRFNVTPILNYNLTFGLDATGGVYFQEGQSKIAVSLAIDVVDGGAVVRIPGLSDVNAILTKTKKNLATAELSVRFDDGDRTSGERLYLTGNTGNDQNQLLKFAATTEFHASVRMTMDRPADQMPVLVRSVLSGVLPSTLSWTATIDHSGILEPGKDFRSTLDYKLNEGSVGEIVSKLQSTSGVEDALRNYALDQIAENNPLSPQLQMALGTKIPLLEKSVMDLLDIPVGLQYLIAPLSFKKQKPAEKPGDTLKFNLDLLSTTSIVQMLSGQRYNIVSVVIDQRYEKLLKEQTIVKDQVIATYFGIVSVTASAALQPGFFLEVFLSAGIDSDGLYINGDTSAVTGKIAKPNIKLGGILWVKPTISGKLTVVPFVSVTAHVGIQAGGTATILSTHGADPKMRISEIKSDQVGLGIAVDLKLKLTGEIGFRDLNLVRPFESKQQQFNLYTSDNGTTLRDVQTKLQSFKSEMESEGRNSIYKAAAATGDPTLVTAAMGLLYEETKDYADAARRALIDYGMNVRAVAVALYAKQRRIAETTKALWAGCGDNLTTLVRGISAAMNNSSFVVSAVVFSQITSDLPRIASAMLADNLYSPKDFIRTLGPKGVVPVDISAVAGIASRLVGGSLSGVVDLLYQGGNFLEPGQIASSMSDRVGGLAKSLSSVASAMSNFLSRSDVFDAICNRDNREDFAGAARAFMNSSGLNYSLQRITSLMRQNYSNNTVADVLYNKLNLNAFQTAKLLSAAGLGPIALARSLKNGANMGITTLTKALYDASGANLSIDDVTKALFSRSGLDLSRYVTARALNQLSGVGTSTIASALKNAGLTDPADVARVLYNSSGLNLSLKDAASALFHGFGNMTFDQALRILNSIA
ncbi:MAG: hypothetical protein ACK58L_01660 [Planctomycetota bacterium]